VLRTAPGRRQLTSFHWRSSVAGAWRASTVMYGRARGRTYVEDYVRVYPDGFQYYPFGLRRRQAPETQQNFINHRRFYEFCAQFASDREVYDIGCGSGHGLGALAAVGPLSLAGCDLSGHAVAYARRHYGDVATITRQDAVQLAYDDDVADVAICSEVLEHVKDYGREHRLLAELARIARPGGLVILSTPNLEISPGHGFAYRELSALIADCFKHALLFENRLWLDESSRRAYETRVENGEVGLLSSCPVEGGKPNSEGADRVPLGPFTVDTSRLHNTHSFVVVAIGG
jgi:2-polyprenyl-3-methyl-5-hydroxy-6-metoxy-1,4-benzoquinol methylase